MTEEQVKKLLRRYLKGEATATEIKQVEDWYSSLNHDSNNLSADKKSAIGENIFLNLQKVMKEDSKLNIFSFRTFYKIAAILLVSSIVAFSIWKLSNKENTSENLITVTTGVAERKKLILTDGSEIFMEPSAKLSYPARFKSNSRNVELKEGEAFFNVAHEEERPFTVHTSGGIKVKVLGTSFRIKSYHAKSSIEVAVSTGKVAVSNQSGLMETVVKDQQLDYDKKAKQASIRKIKSQAFVDLVFEGATLQQIVTKLEYVYGIKILLSDATMAKLKCTANFSTRQQPEEILDIICSLHHLKFNQTKNHKTFKIYR